MSEALQVSLGERSYPIHIGREIAGEGDLYAPHVAGRMAALVTNDVVEPLYAARVESAVRRAGARAVIRIVIPDGESNKDWRTLDRIYAALLEARADRGSVLVAVGGGVVGDMTGFAAATYQRGVAHVQVPTTLLAQVDSSVGGKTAVNHALGKNMVGAFHQPSAVIADTATLDSLPARELGAGLAEVAKYGAIHDLAFLEWMERNAAALLARAPEALAHAIRRSCEIKAQIVAQDERESGVRALLNFGHTFGHAIESALGYGTWLHGEAVGAGMAIAADYSALAGRLPSEDAQRLASLIGSLGLRTRPPAIPTETWLEYMGRDKKNEAGGLTLVLLDRLGHAYVQKKAAIAPLREFLSRL